MTPAERCEECGLPLVECSGLAIARQELALHLVMHRYSKIAARAKAAELIPERRIKR